MDCQQCREAVSARLDGEVDVAESAAIDVHLDGCAACRSAQEQAVRVTELARAYRELEPDPAAVERAALVGPNTRAPECGSNALRLWPLGAAVCGCAVTCGCGCQDGNPCRCGSRAA